MRRAVAVVLVGWLPLALLAAMEARLFDAPLAGSLAGDFALHARSGVAAALFVLADAFCIQRLERVARHFVDCGIVPGDELAGFDAAAASTRKLCGSHAAAIVIAVLAYGLVAALVIFAAAHKYPAWHALSGAGSSTRFSLAGWWHVLVSLPLVLALLLGWMWRLVLWTRFLWLISRLDLQLVAGHPDRAAGLMFLGHSVRAFHLVALALGAIVAGSAVNEVLYAGAPLLRYRYDVLAVAVLAVILFTGPVLVFAGRLSQARLRGALQYGALAQGVGRAFEHKWLTGTKPADREALAAADFSATTDLYSTVANVYAMRLVPVDLMSVAVLLAASLLPFLPVVLLALPFDTILAFLAGLLH